MLVCRAADGISSRRRPPGSGAGPRDLSGWTEGNRSQVRRFQVVRLSCLLAASSGAPTGRGLCLRVRQVGAHAIAAALDVDHRGAVQEPIEDRSGGPANARSTLGVARELWGRAASRKCSGHPWDPVQWAAAHCRLSCPR
jgi:hypothetical protein